MTCDDAGNLYFLQYYYAGYSDADCIRKVDTNGNISTVAGTVPGYGGDGGAATLAMFDTPRDVAVGPDGDLYVADYKNNRVRKVSFGSSSAGGEYVTFADENGLNHVMSASGRHERTLDQNTGVVLREFGYDAEGRLVSITDPRFTGTPV